MHTNAGPQQFSLLRSAPMHESPLNWHAAPRVPRKAARLPPGQCLRWILGITIVGWGAFYGLYRLVRWAFL